MQNPTFDYNNIGPARRRHGLSVSDLNFLLGEGSASRLSRYESGKRLPALKLAIALSTVLEVSVRDLFPGEARNISDRLTRRAETLARGLHDRRQPSEADRRKFQTLLRLACLEGGAE